MSQKVWLARMTGSSFDQTTQEGWRLELLWLVKILFEGPLLGRGVVQRDNRSASRSTCRRWLTWTRTWRPFCSSLCSFSCQRRTICSLNRVDKLWRPAAACQNSFASSSLSPPTFITSRCRFPDSRPAKFFLVFAICRDCDISLQRRKPWIADLIITAQLMATFPNQQGGGLIHGQYS